MKKKLLLFLSLSMATFMLLNAQRSESDYVKGEITLAAGEKINCYIEYYPDSPGILQDGISYVTEDIYKILSGGGKIKGKDIIKLDPKEVASVSFENGKKFKTVTYADLTAVGTATIPRKYIFETMVEGKITLFKKFPSVGGVQFVSGEDALALENQQNLTQEQKIEQANSKYEILIIKDEKNAKSISNIRLPDYISDNTEVNQNFESDIYGDLKSVLSSKIKSASFNDNHPGYAHDLERCITDYNK